MDYRERLKNLRIDNDLGQKDIASICNVSSKTVSHWETLRVEMTVDCIVKLCHHYQISCNYILGLPEYSSPDNK